MRSCLVFLIFLSSIGFAFGQVKNVSFDALHDSYTISSDLNNYGLAPNTTMKVGIDASGKVNRSNLFFPISGIPSNAVVLSAKLQLYVNSGSTSTSELYVERLLSSWDESTITSSNQPNSYSGDGVTTSILGTNLLTGLTYREFDVSSHVKKMLYGTYTNFGWRIKYYNELQTTPNVYTFYTEEDIHYFRLIPNVRDPKLLISYYVPLSVTSATQSHCTTTSSSDGSITPTFGDGCGDTYQYEWLNAAGAVVGNSANLSGVPYGWYGLHAYNTANNDHLYTAFLVGVKCQQVTIDFQPDSKYVDDALIMRQNTAPLEGTHYANLNWGSHQVFSSQTTSDYRYNQYHGYMRFRLWIDPMLNLSQANLLLTGRTHSSGIENEVWIKKISSYWDESLITWNDKPTDTPTNQISVAATTTTNESKTINLLGFWNEWKLNPNDNFGYNLQIKNSSGTIRRMDFHSSDATISTLRPKISFQISIPASFPATVNSTSSICSGSTAVLTATGVPTGTTYQWQKSTDNVNFTNIAGATASTYTTLSSTVVNTYYRCVTTTGICSAVNSNSKLISIKPVPTLTVNNAVFCSGTDVSLRATPSIAGGSYLWNTGATTNTIVVVPDSNTNYTVVYTLNGCASNVATSTVEVCSIVSLYIDSTELGEISIDLSDVSNLQGPFHYFYSKDSIADIFQTFQFLNDSLRDGTLDFATFLQGGDTNTIHTFEGLPLGSYYLAVFDGQGNRVMEKSADLFPVFDLEMGSNMTLSGTTVTAIGNDAHCILPFMFSEEVNGEIRFMIENNNDLQFFGTIDGAEPDPTSIGNFVHGFRIENGNAIVFESGNVIGDPITIQNESVFKLKQENQTMRYFIDGQLVHSATLSEEFLLRSGIFSHLPGLHIRFNPIGLRIIQAFIVLKDVQYFNCKNQIGSFGFKAITPWLGSVPINWQLKKDNVFHSSGNGSSNSLVYPSLSGPGVYQITVSIPGQTYILKKSIFLGYESSWENINMYDLTPNTFSLERDGTNLGMYSYAKSTNVLAQNQIGWFAFKPVVTSSASTNVIRLSFDNPTSTGPVANELLNIITYKDPTTTYITWTLPTNSLAPPVAINPNLPVEILCLTNGVLLLQNGTYLGGFSRPGTASMILRVHSKIASDGFDHVITSFDCGPKQPLSMISHAELKRQLDGGYTLALEGKVKFTFDEEYKIESDKKIPFKIYDDHHHLLVQSDIDGNITNEDGSPSLEVVPILYNFDDNRYELNIATINGLSVNQFFTIEVQTSTNEKRYLKVLYKY